MFLARYYIFSFLVEWIFFTVDGETCVWSRNCACCLDNLLGLALGAFENWEFPKAADLDWHDASFLGGLGVLLRVLS